MCISESQNEVTKIIEKIIEEQLKTANNKSSDFQLLMEQHKVEEVFNTCLLPIYELLKSLQKEKIINTEDYNARLNSLVNILHLIQDLTDKK